MRHRCCSCCCSSNVFICLVRGYSGPMNKKKGDRKMRIATSAKLGHHPGMTERSRDALFERATDLAYRAFDDATDDHIEGVYERLLLNHHWGLGDAGAVT